MSIIGMREEDINSIRHQSAQRLVNEYILNKEMEKSWVEADEFL